ncbi:MAG TPA: MFS transporter [Nocardioidaceae bacterium]
MTWKERLARVRVDTTPLRESRDFRLLFWAGTVFYLGGMVSYVAVPYQLYQLTGSNFAVGALGIVELVPLVVFGLWGGALADHMDRRIMLVSTGMAQILLTSCLMINAFMPSPQVWPLYAIGALLSAAQALQRPSWEALIPRTVKHAQLPAAVSLSSFGMQIGVLGGPAAGGVLLQWVGVPWCFAVDVSGLLVATALFALLRPYPALDTSNPPSVRGIMEGIGYAVRRRDLLGTYIIDIVAMLMAMPTVLFPAFAQDVLKTPSVLGLLYTAGTVGGLLATATSGWTSRVHHHGRAVVIAAAAWGAAIALVGVSSSVLFILFWLTVAGAADMVSGIFRDVIWHQTIPDSMRGRLAGIEMLSYSLGPLGGQTRAGLVADRWSVRAAITTGGVLCVIGVAATAAWLRDFWSYDARTDEHAVRERLVREAAANAG